MVLVSLLLTLVGSFALALPVFASSQATGVAVSAGSNCSQARLDLSMITDASVTHEGGIATNAAGTVLMSFEQSGTLDSFSGTFFGYGMGGWSAQPAGTVIGLYAWIGTPPYSAANSIEWFIAYVCDTMEVVHSCFGPYGSCPQSVTQIPAAGPVAGTVSCPNPRPANYTLRAVPAGAQAFFEPRSDAATGFNLPPGTWFTRPIDGTGFVAVWIACQARLIYIPVENVAG